MGMIKLALDIIENLRQLAASIETLTKSMQAREEAEAGKEDTLETVKTKPITIEKVRAALAEKSRSGKQDEVKALILKYGASKLTEVDPACYGELLKDGEAL